MLHICLLVILFGWTILFWFIFSAFRKLSIMWCFCFLLFGLICSQLQVHTLSNCSRFLKVCMAATTLIQGTRTHGHQSPFKLQQTQRLWTHPKTVYEYTEATLSTLILSVSPEVQYIHRCLNKLTTSSTLSASEETFRLSYSDSSLNKQKETGICMLVVKLIDLVVTPFWQLAITAARVDKTQPQIITLKQMDLSFL